MNRRGVALLAVLWVVTALASLAGVSMAVVRIGARTSRNRLLLGRAGWAREACAEILLARYSAEAGVIALDTVDLGRGTWCRASMTDPAAALNVNLASPDALLQVLRRPALVDAVLDWRDEDDLVRPDGAEAAWYRERGRAPPRNGPLADVAELGLVRGFDDSVLSRVEPLLTTRGDGRINPAMAAADVIAGLPGVDAAAAFERLVGVSPPRTLDDWLARVPASSRPAMLAQYRALLAATTFVPASLVVTIEGGVRGTRIVASATLTVVPVANRLAVIRRETM
jgi:general secretion pathway protein K